MSAARMVTGLIGAFGGGTLGRMLGGRTGGMIGSMAGSLLARKGGGIGSLLGGLTGGGNDDNSANAAADMDEAEAMILVRAMCSAAKADGQVDASEIDAIMQRAGDLDPEDERMLRSELRSDLDLDGLIADVPRGMEAEVYAMSLLPITVDSPEEVQYLGTLAQRLELSADQVRSIHDELGLN